MTFIRMEVTTPKCVRKRNWFVVVVLSRPQKEEWPVARLLSEFYVSSGKLLDCFFSPSKSFSVSAIHLDKRARNSINHNLQRTKK